jgi:hypothetical protein
MDEKKHIKLLQAKAFEAGRILVGTYIEISMDRTYEFDDYIERVSNYLEDIGITATTLNLFDSKIDYDKLLKIHKQIDNQFWGKHGYLAPYFDAGVHLFATIPENDINEFKTTLSTLDIPEILKKEKENTMEWFSALRQYFESIIFQTPESNVDSSNKIFLIHGHDNSVKNEIARFIENELKLEVTILHEKPNYGRHIFEKFEDESNVSFAIALLTPDDETNEGTKRARQNVIFEMGYFLGKLGKGNVLLLKKGSVEIPSDLHGVVYVSYEGQWKDELRKEILK